MKIFVTLALGCCLMLGLSLVAGCSGSAFQQPPPPVNSTLPSSPTPPMSPTPAALSLINPQPAQPPANVGQPFGINLYNYIQGGVGSITFQLKSGVLPNGLTFSSGSISGIPTAVSVSTAVYTVTDSASPPRSVTLSPSIVIAAMLPLAISPSSGTLPSGTVGARYNPHLYAIPFSCGGRGCRRRYGYTISATGGFVPYSFVWATTSSSVPPPGLTFDSTTGLIDGTPTTAGTFNFTVTVADSESPPGHQSAVYTIAVASTPTPSPSPSSSP